MIKINIKLVVLFMIILLIVLKDGLFNPNKYISFTDYLLDILFAIILTTILWYTSPFIFNHIKFVI